MAARRFALQSRPSSSPGGAWSQEEGRLFFQAFAKYNAPGGASWAKVAKAVGTRDAAACEALYYRHQAYLSLPRGVQHQLAFLAMLRDHTAMVRTIGLLFGCWCAAARLLCAAPGFSPHAWPAHGLHDALQSPKCQG